MTKIRPEVESDRDEVVCLHILAWQKAYRGMLPDDVLDALDHADWAERRRQRFGERASLVAESDGVIVGFVSYGPDRENEVDGEIQAIYVHPDHWGKGIGDLLLQAALDALPQKEIHLWVLEENVRALRFYTKYGLHPDGTRSTYRPRGSAFDASDIRCTLTRA